MQNQKSEELDIALELKTSEKLMNLPWDDAGNGWCGIMRIYLPIGRNRK